MSGQVSGQPLDLMQFNLTKSALIEASAGTGKTYTITYLILRLLLNVGRQGNLTQALLLEQILVVTFTNAAAADLKARIRDKIRQARLCLTAAEAGEDISHFDETMLKLVDLIKDNCAQSTKAGMDLSLLDYARLLQRAERDIDKAAICTIHSFCNSALNQIYAFEAGEAFETELCTDLSALQEEAFISTWRQCFYQRDEDEVMAQLKLLGSADPASLYAHYQSLTRVRTPGHATGMVLNFAIKNNTQHLDRSKKNAATLFAAMQEHLTATLPDIQAQLEHALTTMRALIAPLREDLNLALNKRSNSLLLLKDGKCAEFKKEGLEFLGRLVTLIDSNAPDFFILKERDAATCQVEEDGWMSRAKSNLKKMSDEPRYTAWRRGLCTQINQILPLLAQLQSLRVEFRTALCLLADANFSKLKAQHAQMSFDDVLLRLNQALHLSQGRGEALAAMIRARYPIAMVDEFQDTDPVQYAIFEQLYLQSEVPARCYLIGDPKQSIYSFRGSDINSYLKARQRIIECAGSECIYTLDTNYRSAPQVVKSVNALFSCEVNPQNISPFLLPEVSFNSVNDDKGKMKFHFVGQEEQAALVYLIPGDKASKQALLAKLAEACAQQVVQVLQQGRLKLAEGSERTVQPHDIAILVRSRAESDAVIAALERHQVGAVFYSDKNSVLGSADEPSAEALDIQYLMEALCDPPDRAAVVRLLGSSLLSLSGPELMELLSDAHFENEVWLLTQLQQEWLHNGFLTAFMHWMQAPTHNGLQRILSFSDGERRLTNYLHIAELMQQQFGVIKGVKAQLRWYVQLLQGNQDAGVNPDEVVKRLESERQQVQIRTIHISKGLEFPLVMLPFLGLYDRKCTRSGDILFYDRHEQRQLLDLYGQEDSAQAANLQELQEDMRLSYVALTRACACNFIFLGPQQIRSDYVARSFVYLLCGDNSKDGPQPLPKDTLTQAVTNLARCPQLFTLQTLSEGFENEEPTLYQAEPEDLGQLAAAQLPPGAAQEDFSISSYSALVSGLHDRFSVSERDDSADGQMENPGQGLSPFDFPRGTQAGSLLHLMLERCDFAALKGKSATEQLNYCRALCEKLTSCQYSQVFAQWTAQLGDGIEALAHWLNTIVQARLPGADGQSFALEDLTAGSFIPEMRYLVPVDHLDSRALNALCLKNARQISELHGKIPPLHLDNRQVNGFLTGSLDLVCRWGQPGHERYYVIDYKSTYLGGDFNAYASAQVAASVFDPRNRYDVQYLIYTVALHRLLKVRLKDYDYERDVGGVLYLYLRGLHSRPTPSAGVFYTKAPRELIERLDALLGGN